MFSKGVPLRLGMPITWTTGEDGEVVPLSKYGDDRIDMSPYLPNPAATQRYITLLPVPSEWQDSFLDAVLAFWRYGCPGSTKPKASTVIGTAASLTNFIVWLDKKNIKSFREVIPAHYVMYAAYLRDVPIESGTRKGKTRTPGGIASSMVAALIPWKMRAKVRDPVREVPFAFHGRLMKAARGGRVGDRSLKTYCMTWEEVRRLFNACEKGMEGAEDTLSAMEKRAAFLAEDRQAAAAPRARAYLLSKWMKKNLPMTTGQLSARVAELREAASTALMLIVGIRISEFLSIESDCLTRGDLGEESVLWLSSKTYKSKPDELDGSVTEWIAPELTERLIGYLARISNLQRDGLERNIKHLEQELQAKLNPKKFAELQQMLSRARAARRSIFLGRVVSKGDRAKDGIGRVDRATVDKWVKNMGKRAGISTRISPHVLRRTFAFMVVHQCHGDIRYLKIHFQHWNIDTTTAYASHPERDVELADSIGAELLELKTDMVSRWLQEDEVLSGAGGRHIVDRRAQKEFCGHTLKDRRELAILLQSGVNIRPTGHSWCVASGAAPCGGRGLYDPKECASDCGGAVITEAEVHIWKQLAVQMIEARVLDDCGPAGRQAIDESLAAFDKVLKPFGLSVAIVENSLKQARHES